MTLDAGVEALLETQTYPCLLTRNIEFKLGKSTETTNLQSALLGLLLTRAMVIGRRPSRQGGPNLDTIQNGSYSPTLERHLISRIAAENLSHIQ